MDRVPRCEFQKRVARYDGNCKFRGFSCLDRFLCLAFAQLTFRESLRDIEACLRSETSKLYHMGFRGTVSRSTLADANESHNWRIYADFAQVLIHIARPMYASEPCSCCGMVRREIEIEEDADRILTDLASEYEGDLSLALADQVHARGGLEELAERGESANESALRALRDRSEGGLREGRTVAWEDVKARNAL